jgi:tetratricopeptide (TPR) repeat protein
VRLAVVLCALAAGASGCTEVRGRKMIQEANEQYRQGHYQEAVTLFEKAEPLVPHLPVLWLNKGYTCRQLIVPGAVSRQAADCALAAFARFGQLRPSDPRADQLSIQTLFDAGAAQDLAALEQLFLQRNRNNPQDIDVIQGLQQVYYKGGNWPLALLWSRKAAAIRNQQAEAQYAVGTFIWQVLSSHGGGAAMASFDPRPKISEPAEESAEPAPRRARSKNKPAVEVPQAPTAPSTLPTDITGQQRIELAEEGIEYLEKALALRPRYPEAMTYLGLLYRQKSFAFFADAPRWQGVVNVANEWQQKATQARTR